MTAQVMQGDVRETLKTLTSDSVHCCVTSPPYWALRSYLKPGHPLKALEIGSEPTPEEFIQTMVAVFREVRRVLHPSATCWVNIGDSYAHDNPSGPQGPTQHRDGRTFTAQGAGGRNHGLKPKDLCLIPERLAIALQADGWWVRSRIAWCKKSPMPESVTDRPTSAWEHVWLLTKSARYFYDAEAVKEPSQDVSGRVIPDGWKEPDGSWGNRDLAEGKRGGMRSPAHYEGCPASGRNLRNFWLLGPEPYSEAHFATFPTEIPKRAILAGTSARGCCPKCLAPWERVVDRKTSSSRQGEGYLVGSGRNDGGGTRHGSFTDAETRTTGWRPTCECYGTEPLPEYPDEPEKDQNGKVHPEDQERYDLQCDAVTQKTKRLLREWQSLPTIPCTVLDPFAGSGTTLAVAIELGRRAIGCELNPDYVHMIHDRTNVTPGLSLA